MLKHIPAFFLSLLIGLHICGCSTKTKEIASQSEIGHFESTAQASPAPPSIDPVEEGRKNLRNNWTNLIHVIKGPYKTGQDNTGIYNLTATVENTSIYPFDSVIIFVSYFKGSDCIAVAPVPVKDIAAQGKSVVKVPDNKEAERFQFQVRKAHSNTLELCYDIDDYNREGDDPYHCR